MGEGETRRRRWWPHWGAKAIAESLLIVFSVVLALGVSEWADNRRTAARVQEMRGFVIDEIKANRALLARDANLPHHLRLKAIFGRAVGRPGRQMTRAEAEPAITAMLKTGLHQATLQDAVWTSLVSSDLLAELEPREMFALARLYRTQESMITLNRGGYEQAMGLLDILSRGDDSVTKPMVRMTLFLEDLTAFERNMIRQYDATLATLEADARKP